MSKAYQIKVNYAGVGELLKSDEMAALMQEYAQQTQQKAGDGYATDVFYGNSRVMASVYTETQEAAKDNLENNTLLKALGG